MIRCFFIIIGFLALVIYLAGFRSDARFLKIVSDQGTHKLKVEIVKTEEKKRTGLMRRESLPEDRGMLFVYDDNSHPYIWMKNMLIHLDIVFIGWDLKINHIERDVQPCVAMDDNQCIRYKSSYPSTFVLELPAGFTMQYGIDQGDEIILPSGIQ